MIDARGRDSRGQGNANAVISAELRSEGSSTVVSVGTDLAIAGRIAQFGSGMIAEVSARLLGQFVDCLEGKLGEAPQSADDAAAGPGSSAGPARSPGSPGSASPHGSAGPVTIAAGPEPAALNLMSVAGRAVYKRLVPLAVGIVVVAVVIYLIAR